MTNQRIAVFNHNSLRVLRAATEEEFMSDQPFYKNRSIFQNRHKIVLKNQIKPVDLFCYLTARFGRPMGVFSQVEREKIKEAICWHFRLSMPEGKVDVLSLNFRTEVYLPSCYVCSAEEFSEVVKADIPNHYATIAKIKKYLTKWDSFLNPYAQLRESSLLLMSRAESLEAVVRKNMDDPDSPASAIKFKQVFDQHYPMALELSGLCLSVRMMCPVMAEAFLNLLVLAFATDESRTSVGLEGLYRMSLDAKVKKIHLLCDHFLAPVDWGSKACKDFDNLRNRRNDLLHGNVRPKKQRFETVYLWGDVPLFTQVLGPYQRALGSKMAAFPLSEARRDLDIVDSFISYIISLMREDVGAEMENILGSIDLGYDSGRKKLGVLFANAHHDVMIDEMY